MYFLSMDFIVAKYDLKGYIDQTCLTHCRLLGHHLKNKQNKTK